MARVQASKSPDAQARSSSANQLAKLLQNVCTVGSSAIAKLLSRYAPSWSPSLRARRPVLASRATAVNCELRTRGMIPRKAHGTFTVHQSQIRMACLYCLNVLCSRSCEPNNRSSTEWDRPHIEATQRTCKSATGVQCARVGTRLRRWLWYRLVPRIRFSDELLGLNPVVAVSQLAAHPLEAFVYRTGHCLQGVTARVTPSCKDPSTRTQNAVLAWHSKAQQCCVAPVDWHTSPILHGFEAQSSSATSHVSPSKPVPQWQLNDQSCVWQAAPFCSTNEIMRPIKQKRQR